MAKDMAVDFSALDPDSVASSSTPKMSHQAVNGVRSHQTTIRPNEEENESVYSLHLSALGPISPISTLQDDHELRAGLEEPGGPSDFTQNMFDWINGPAKHNIAAAYQSPQSVIHNHAQQAQIDEQESVHEQDVKHSTARKEKHLLDMTAEEVEEKFAKLQDRCDELQTMWDQLNARFQKQKLEYAEEARFQKEKLEHAEETRLQEQRLESAKNAGGLRTPESRKSSTNDDGKDAQDRQYKQSSVDYADHKKSQDRATLQSQQDEINQLKQQLKNEQALRRKERDAASIREAELVRSYESMMQQLAESHAKTMSPQLKRPDLKDDVATPVHDSNIRRSSHKVVNSRAQDAHAAENASRFVDRAASPKIVARQVEKQVQDRAVSPGQTAADAKTRNKEITELETIVVRLQDKLISERENHAAAILALKTEYDAVEKDVDAWMLDQVEQRKRVTDASAAKKDKKISSLKMKVDELEHLNARYEKELMLSWGREEFGRAPPGEKQKYRYRYT